MRSGLIGSEEASDPMPEIGTGVLTGARIENLVGAKSRVPQVFYSFVGQATVIEEADDGVIWIDRHLYAPFCLGQLSKVTCSYHAGGGERDTLAKPLSFPASVQWK